MSSGEGVAGGSAGEERGNADVASPPPTTTAALPPRKPWDSGGGAAPSTPISELLPPQPLASAAEPTAGAELREDQVANAVAFLSHPKVRGSTESSKRAFLQKKGLTQAEIAEAFRRVPTPSAAPAGSDTVSPPAASVPPLSSSQLGTPSRTETTHTAKPQPLRWSQVVVGAGLTALITVGVRRLLEPYRYHILHSLSRAIAPAEDLAAEAKAAQDKEERDATLLARSVASLEEQTAHLATSVQALTTNVSLMQFSRQPQSPAPQPAIPQELQTTLADLARTLQSLGSVKEAESGSNVKAEIQEIKSLVTNKVAASSVGRGMQPQRGPIAPPTMNQVRPPTWAAPADSKGKAPMQAPKSTSYQEVLQMLEQGKMPPGIRTDIADTPPNPNLPPSSSQAQPRRKPWESATLGDGSSQDTTASSGQAPFWLQQGHGAEEELPKAPAVNISHSLPDTIAATGPDMTMGGVEYEVGKPAAESNNLSEARSVFEQQVKQAELSASNGPFPSVAAPPASSTAAVVEELSGVEEERWTPPARPKPVFPRQQNASAPAAATYASVVDEGGTSGVA